MIPALVTVTIAAAFLGLLRLSAIRGATVDAQADRIAELERDLAKEKANTENRFRPKPLPEWATKDDKTPALVQGQRRLELPAVIDRPYDSAHTEEHPAVGDRSRVHADLNAGGPHA